MFHPIALRLVAIVVLLPTTWVAGVTSLSGFGFVADALLRNQQPGAAAQVLAALVAGWIGLGTCWRLYYCLMRKDLGFDQRRAWWGLACATLFAIGLIATGAGPLVARIVYFGWPLLAVAFFGSVLWRLRGKHPAV